MRIGELSARTGVSAATLRVWESRYGLLQPSRTVGGYRIYGPGDERRVREVLRLQEERVSAGAAAARVLAAERTSPAEADPSEAESAGTMADSSDLVARLHDATDAFDEQSAAAALDEAFTAFSLEDAIDDVVLRYLSELGDRWESGAVSVAHEHFGASLVRRRLSTFSVTWSLGNGPLAVLACPPGESHDLALLAYGVLLGRAGWRIRFLGGDVPVADLTRACDVIAPDLVVLAASREGAVTAAAPALRLLARSYPIAIGGRGATEDATQSVGALQLPSDLVQAMQRDVRVR